MRIKVGKTYRARDDRTWYCVEIKGEIAILSSSKSDDWILHVRSDTGRVDTIGDEKYGNDLLEEVMEATKPQAEQDYIEVIARGLFRGSFSDWMAMTQDERERYVYDHSPKPTVYSHDRWSTMVEEIFDEVRHLAKAKGGEYSGDVDRLLNFRRNGTALDLPMETIWAVYSAKHWDAIMQYIKDLKSGKTRERMEPIDGRIKDLIVYLLLLNAMVEERATT
jgi:hypothetical protein